MDVRTSGDRESTDARAEVRMLEATLDSLATEVLDGRITLEQARRVAARDAVDPTGPLGPRLIEIDRLLGDDRVPEAVVHAWLLFDAVDRSGVAPTSDGIAAATMLVAAESRAIGPDGWDVPRFRRDEDLAARTVAISRHAVEAGSRPRVLAEALFASARLRRAFVDERPPEFWAPDGRWRGALAGRPISVESSDDVLAYRLDDAAAQIEVAITELREAESLFDGPDGVPARSVVVAVHLAALLVQRAEREPAFVAEAEEHLRRLVERSDDPRVDDACALLLERLVGGERTPTGGGGPTGVADPDTLLAWLSVAERRGPAAAADLFTRLAASVDVESLDSDRRTIWYSRLGHVLDRGAVPCETADDVDGALARLQGADPMVRAAGVAHLVAHTRSLADAARAFVAAPPSTPLLGKVLYHAFGERAWRAIDELEPSVGYVGTAAPARVALQAYLITREDREVATMLRTWARRSRDQPASVAMDQAVLLVGELAPALGGHPSAEDRAAFEALGVAVGREDDRESSPGGVLGVRLHRWVFQAPWFGSAVASAPAEEESADAIALRLAAEEFAAGLPLASPDVEADVVDEERVRVAVFDAREQHQGGSDAQRLANLRRRYERLATFPDLPPMPPDSGLEPDRVFATFDAAASGRTVVWSTSPGLDVDGRPVISSSMWRTVPHPETGRPAGFGYTVRTGVRAPALRRSPTEESSGITLHPVAEAVARLRAALREQLPGETVGPEAQEQLDDLGEVFVAPFRPLLDIAADLGADVLRFVPAAPFAFAPMHLLPDGSGRILADRWTVVVTPSARMLAPRRSAPAGRGLVAVAAPGGGVPYGLPSTPALLDQVMRIATTFGTEPLRDASVDAVLGAAEHARYLHIAAHGTDYAPAPSFQCLFLDGEAGRDGRMYAHQVLRHDLRGLRLVTLSACESALGRADAGGNLHGMVSAFLRAGAGAVVAALWPVATDVSVVFFVELYAALRLGVAPVDAFRAAQTVARERHPGYKDWGAFVFVGDPGEARTTS
jgi:CHAT domain-containing protein